MTDNQYLIQIGKNIAHQRKKKGWTQLEFAEKLGMHRTGLTRIELGKVNTTILKLRLIAGALGIKLGQILDEQSNYEI